MVMASEWNACVITKIRTNTGGTRLRIQRTEVRASHAREVMMMREWIKKSDKLPTEADCDALGCVLVWHIYQGAMVYGMQVTIENKFITHWMRAPEAPEECRKLKNST